MRKKYSINFLPLFYDDLDRITDYIMYKLGNKIAAESLIDDIEKEIEKRANNPESYEQFKSIKNRKSTYYAIWDVDDWQKLPVIYVPNGTQWQKNSNYNFSPYIYFSHILL